MRVPGRGRWAVALALLLVAHAVATACSVDSGRSLHAGTGGSSGALLGDDDTSGDSSVPSGNGSGNGTGGAGTTVAGSAGEGGAPAVEPDPDSVCDNPSGCVACSACRDGTACADEVTACAANAACKGLSGCLNGCTSDDCVERCNALYARGTKLLAAALTCLGCACEDLCARPDLECP